MKIYKTFNNFMDTLYKKNSFIQSIGLNNPYYSEKIINNLYYNYTHKVTNTNSSYIVRPLTVENNKARFMKYLMNEHIPFQSDIYVDDCCFDFFILNSEFIIQLVNSHKPIDVSHYNSVATKHNLQCYFIFDFDRYETFVKSLISRYTIPISDVVITQIDYDTATKFYNRYSLYYTDLKYAINIGLVKNNKVVSCISFKIVDAAINNWQIVSICSKFHYDVVSGYSKILEYFRSHFDPSMIVATVDLSKSNGLMFSSLGFKLDKHIKEERIYTQYKSGLSESLIKFILNIAENEISDMMQSLNYNVVTNCGYDAYILQ